VLLSLVCLNITLCYGGRYSQAIGQLRNIPGICLGFGTTQLVVEVGYMQFYV
jgi:hypothetical protein